MTDLMISFSQLDVKEGLPEYNLESTRQMIAEAARRNSDLVIFPELWLSGFDLKNAGRYATSLKDGAFAQIGTLARQHQIHVYGSLLSELEPGCYGNTAVLFGTKGEQIADYTKLHLFRRMQEEKYLIPGRKPQKTETDWGLTGLSICYDLRFPELFRYYALAGVEIILLSAQWPHPRLKHWRTLLQARAVENQIYIAACNRVGMTDDTAFFGHSCVIDPWGEFILETGEQAGLYTVAIPMERVAEARRKFPVLSDYRPDLIERLHSLNRD
jgi:predicted amidohydrolase